MNTEVLLGDEAVGLAAIHAGIGGAFSYPGTPATEIFEFIEARTAGCGGVWAAWSANEKVALEEALGMSFVGRRALVSMKHVGLNVAADPFMSAALVGLVGGLVLAVADDPGMHSSQNEQDTRFFGDFARVPVLEPSNQQEAYDMTLEAFELSERFHIPVIVRLVTRISHSRANVLVRATTQSPPAAARSEPPPLPDWRDWTLMPLNARRRNRRLLDIQPDLRIWSEHSPFNHLRLAGPSGVLASGIANNYVGEALQGQADLSLLKIGTYPAPAAKIRELVNHCEDLLIVEEGYPLLERQISGLLGVPGKVIRGKLSGALPEDGELTPDLVAAAIHPGLARRERVVPAIPVEDLVGRPPVLCGGCPHADTFKLISDATAAFPRRILFSDIGCYTLGALPPFSAVHTCVDMGASIAMAHGAAQSGAFPVLCTIGDSTFTHSGMTPLLGAARTNADMTVIILDNAAVAMTGGQESLVVGEELVGLLRGLGVAPAHLHVIEPLTKHHARNVELLSREVSYRGLSVIVSRRVCIHAKRHQAAPSRVPAAAGV